MDFRLSDDQHAVLAAVQALCSDRFDLADIAGREGKPADPAAWLALADLGVLGLLADDPSAAIGIVEASIVFEALGAHLATGPVLWSALAAPFVEGVAAGDVRVAGVDVADGTDGPLVVEHFDESDALLLLRRDRVELCHRADLPPAAEGSPPDPLTPAGGLTSAPAGHIVGGAEAAQQVRRSGAVLSAALLVGTAQGALDVARAYALEREQFGVPIGSFQAIKHLLADMYVRVELARATTYAAAAVAAGRGTGDPDVSAGAAKLLAGEAGIGNGRAAVQILGGMGFTWEMLPHYYLKRSWVLEHCFGTAATHASRLGACVAGR